MPRFVAKGTVCISCEAANEMAAEIKIRRLRESLNARNGVTVSLEEPHDKPGKIYIGVAKP